MKQKTIKWTGLAINGVVAFLVGLVFIILPQTLIETMIKFLGVIVGLSGLTMLIFQFFNKKSQGQINIYYLFQGIVNLGLGILMVARPSFLVQFIFFAIGLWALIIGAFQVVFALNNRRQIQSNLFLLINGILFSALGLLMIFYPDFVMNTILELFGAIVSLLGVVLLYFSFLVRKQNQLNSIFEVKEIVNTNETIDITEDQNI